MNNRSAAKPYAAPLLEIHSWLPGMPLSDDYAFLNTQKPAREIYPTNPNLIDKKGESPLDELVEEFEARARRTEHEKRVYAGYRGESHLFQEGESLRTAFLIMMILWTE